MKFARPFFSLVMLASGCRDAPGVSSPLAGTGTSSDATGPTGETDTHTGGTADVDDGTADQTGTTDDLPDDLPDDGEDASSTGDPVTPPPWEWDLPPGLPIPYVPADNPMSAAKVALGRHLFYDTRLSGNGTYSCATCHQQELAFTDGLGRAEGSTGQIHPRGSMSLANIAYASTLAWGNPELLELEEHALGPMFGDQPVELGLVDEADTLAKIAGDPLYTQLFAAAFPDLEDPQTLDSIVKAIASFQRTFISGRAPFDRWFYEGDESAISEAAKRGWQAFNFPGECTYCHFSFNFTDATYFESLPQWSTPFHNTGLYNVDGEGAYPPGNEGLFNFTAEAADMGKFKSPTLRNIALTAPYMHDGSIATLEEVLEHYAVGGRADTPFADVQMKTFELEPAMTADLLAFLDSLTDDAFLTDPALSDPWK